MTARTRAWEARCHTVGAAALVLFVFLGLLAVLLLYLSDPDHHARHCEGVRWALIALAWLEGRAALAIAWDHGDGLSAWWAGGVAALSDSERQVLPYIGPQGLRELREALGEFNDGAMHG